MEISLFRIIGLWTSVIGLWRILCVMGWRGEDRRYLSEEFVDFIVDVRVGSEDVVSKRRGFLSVVFRY